MAAAQHKLSRRALLAGACAGAALPLPRHSGLDPESILPAPQPEGRWTKALARYARAEAGLDALAHTEDDGLYDRALGRHNAALARLLRTAAPDLAAVTAKLDLILRHEVFDLSFSDAAFSSLRADLGRFAGQCSGGSTVQLVV